MSLIRFEKVSKSFAGVPVLSEIDLRVEEGERIALIGRNGTGKTTIFRLITGETDPDSGVVERMRRLCAVHLAQLPDVPPGACVHDIAMSGFQDLLTMEAELRGLEARMAADDAAAMAAYGEKQHVFSVQEGYTFRSRVKQILSGLGFAEADFGLPFHALSGGQRSRLLLGLALLRDADLLLLDEPENHLDMEAREWLEAHLQERPEALVVISHDRRMINTLARRIFEMERGRLTAFTGNYDAWMREKELRRERQQQAYARQEAFLQKEQSWIERFRYKNTKARQVQSRIKRLQDMELVEAPESELAGVSFGMSGVTRSGETVLEATDLSMAYGSLRLYDNLSLGVHRGERLVIIGPNGAGKTTLLHQLAGRHDGLGGTARRGHNVTLALYEQHQEQLASRADVLTEIQRTRSDWTTQQCRTYLGRFLFRGEDVFKAVNVLSGGERSRLALAKLIAGGANLLLLDEPTNHLDIASREALETALTEFPGTLVIITHDRMLVDRLADRLLVVQGGDARVFYGNYTRYREWLQQETASRSSETSPKTAFSPRNQSEIRETRKKQERTARREQRRLEQLEAKIQALEGEVNAYHGQFESLGPMDFERAGELAAAYEQAKQRLESLYAQWSALAE